MFKVILALLTGVLAGAWLSSDISTYYCETHGWFTGTSDKVFTCAPSKP